MPDERTSLLSHPNEDVQDNGACVLQLRDWIDDPYEQVAQLPSEKYSGGERAVGAQYQDNHSFIRQGKVVALSCLMLVSLVVSMFYIEESKDSYLISPCYISQRRIVIEDISYCNRVAVKITGNIFKDSVDKPGNDTVKIQLRMKLGSNITYNVPVEPPVHIKATGKKSSKVAEMTSIDHIFYVESLEDVVSMAMFAYPESIDSCTSINVSYQCRSFAQDYTVVVAIGLLLVVYSLIMSELIHRTSAALLGSSLGIAALAILNMRPELMQIIAWIDWETLALLMGMMLMVAMLADSGFFDWAAVKVYELSRGRVWVLVTLLNLVTAVLSAFLDNVTTILLISPITITLCQVMHLDPKKVLLSLVMFSNIGGASTGIGDPPNVLIINSDQIKDDISFGTFTLHMSLGSILCVAAAYTYLWLIYGRKGDELLLQNCEVEELFREAELWKRIADRSYMGNNEEVAVKEMLASKASHVKHLAEEKLVTPKSSTVSYAVNLPKLRAKYGIRDKGKLIKTAIVLAVCIILFFIYSLPNIHTAPGEIAMAGAIALIILLDQQDMEGLLQHVEWATLMFFAGLFILVECLSKLGLIDTIGEEAADLIESIDPKYQLAAAISIIIWMSALISAFIDNIPFTAGIIPVIAKICEDTGLPLEPLTYALAFGACLGGNGTLIGASANVVAVGIAEEKGYKITFWGFAKLGMPIMIITVTVAHAYLLLCHCAFQWHHHN